LQEVLIVLVKQPLATSAGLISKRGRVTVRAVGLDPVVDALSSHAEHPGNVSRGAALVELQHRQSAPIQRNVCGFPELTPQALRCQ
jgi:hypothetical protein